MTAPLTEYEIARAIIAVVVLQLLAVYGAWRLVKDHVEPHVTKWVAAGLARLFQNEP